MTRRLLRMLWKLLKTERMKLKRSPVWLAFLIMPVIPAVLGTANFLANQGVLSMEWYSLWTQHTLFTDYFFLPIMLGVYCAYLMRLEHLNRNWNKIFALPVGRGLVFVAKFVTAAFLLLVSEAWIGALFVISGCYVGLAAPPYRDIIIWCLFGTLGGMVMAAIQLVLSMLVQSFALPVGISFAGGLSGLLFLAKDLGHIWPYSLMAYGMNSNARQVLTESGYLWFVAVCVLYIAAAVITGSILAGKRDV